MTADDGAPRARDINEVARPSFIKEFAASIGKLHLSAFAAALAYGAVFALVPVLVLLVLLLGVFHAQDLVERSLSELSTVLPSDAISLLDDQLSSITATNRQGSFGLGVFVSAAIALWGASGAMRRVIQALNVVHRVEEKRGFVKRLIVSILLAIGAIAAIASTVVIIVLGGSVAEQVFDVLGISGAAATWAWIRWPLLLLIAWFGIATAYRFAPAQRRCGGFATPGTLLATFGWVGFSALFSWYIGGIGDMRATWGSVAGIIVFLLYLQYTGLIVLLGALVDVQLWDQNQSSSRLRRWLRSTPTP